MKKNYLARTAVSVLCACSMVFTVISPIAVFASNTDSVISQTQESLPVSPSYDSVYRISNQHIKSIANNAGNYGQSVIAKAIDGNPATHWETNRPNNWKRRVNQ